MIDHEPQQRLAADLLAVMRGGAAAAVARGASFIAPAHVMEGLLADPRVGPALAPIVTRGRLERSAEDAAHKLPDILPLPEIGVARGEEPAFARFDSLAFRTPDGASTLYLDADALHVFVEGARRAGETYRAKHLLLGFTAEAVKDRDVLSLFGVDPLDVARVVDALPDAENEPA
ncbi:MAG TPA: hypothetical protein VFB22_16940 [Candidatus Baltobacteraceae bacterium]|nr:hypothetical protein [Candidatus Baltobacteraceae bacterium]